MALTLKVSFNKDIRRVTLAKKPTYSELFDVVQNMFRFSQEAEVAIKYVDEDEELVRITNDMELSEALTTLKKTQSAKQLLRLYVADTNATVAEGADVDALAQLLSSMSLPGIQESISQLQMLASMSHGGSPAGSPSPAWSRPSPFGSSPSSAPNFFGVPDWSRPQGPYQHSFQGPPASQAQAAPFSQSAATEASRNLTKSGGYAEGVSASSPYSTEGKPYVFRPDDLKPVTVENAAPGPCVSKMAEENQEVAVAQKPMSVTVVPKSQIPAHLLAAAPSDSAAEAFTKDEEPKVESPIIEEAKAEPVVERVEAAPVVEAEPAPAIEPLTPSKPIVEEYKARFLRDAEVGDQAVLQPFQSFVRGWVMRNDGNSPWPKGTKMVWVAGDKLSPKLMVDVDLIQPGEETEVSMSMVAPGRPGRYVGYYRLVLPSGVRFGHRVWVDITVQEPVKNPVMNLPPSSSISLPHLSSSPLAPSAPSIPEECAVPSHLTSVFNTLSGMGFTNKAQVLAALEQHDGNIERAIEELLKGLVK